MPTPAENYEGRPVIVYIKAPSDISCFEKAVAHHFGKTTIVHDWKKDTAVTEDALHISCDPAIKHAVCLTRKGKVPAYVFKFDDIFEEVQTSALPKKHTTSTRLEVA